MEKIIIIYEGKQYYRLEDHEKLGIGALHCKTYDFDNGDAHPRVHPIKHARSIGKKPPDFKERYFFNRVPPPVIKKQKFKIENIFIEK
jgi:hypothetical protein